MSKEKFIDGYLERLIDKDDDIKKMFTDASSDRERELLKTNLRMSLDNSYNTYAKDYFEPGMLGTLANYTSRFLRYAGAGADTWADYTIWSLGPGGIYVTAPAAFGFKGAGLAVKSLADLIDGYKYLRHAKTDGAGEKIKDFAKIIGEGVLERAASYVPGFGLGILDFMYGRDKFDRKVTARALSHAKKNFLNYIPSEEKEPYLVSKDRFRNPDYALEDRTREESLTLAA